MPLPRQKRQGKEGMRYEISIKDHGFQSEVWEKPTLEIAIFVHHTDIAELRSMK